MFPSTFVPNNRRSVTRAPRTGITLKMTRPENVPSANPTILLVDDDAAVRESLERVLANEGWRVISAANGAEALEHLSETKPALMITDLCMPDVNGWDMLFYESMNRPDLPIFVISGLPPRETGGADHFAAEFFPKPLDLDALLLAVRRNLGAAHGD